MQQSAQNLETAKANNLAPRDYIQFLFENLPDMEIQTHPERLKQILPLGKLIQETLHNKMRHPIPSRVPLVFL